MVKKFDIPCNFNGQIAPVTLFIGDPHPEHHPLNFQAKWLSSVKGGQIPSDIMDSFAKIRDLAVENGISFEELCFYAVGVANGSIENNNQQYAKLIENIENNENNENV